MRRKKTAATMQTLADNSGLCSLCRIKIMISGSLSLVTQRIWYCAHRYPLSHIRPLLWYKSVHRALARPPKKTRPVSEWLAQNGSIPWNPEQLCRVRLGNLAIVCKIRNLLGTHLPEIREAGTSRLNFHPARSL